MSDMQKLLIGHGALVMWVGFVVGFGFAFFLLGRVELWPIPGSIETQLPGPTMPGGWHTLKVC